MADETGLGKTHVAQEVIAQTLKHLEQVDHVGRIDIVYVCSNADIAAQNIRKLDVTNSERPSFATRLSLLITQPDVLEPRPGGKGKPTTFVAFTPATSFQFGWQLGTAKERAVLYVLLRDHLGLQGARATAAERIFQGFVSSRQRFVDWYIAPVRARPFETNIRQRFLENFDRSSERAQLDTLIGEVAGRRSLTATQHESARHDRGRAAPNAGASRCGGARAGPGNPGRVPALSGSARRQDRRRSRRTGTRVLQPVRCAGAVALGNAV